MKKILINIFAFLVLPAYGQDIAQFKDVPMGNIVNEKAYTEGNRYQKDALLFMDMLAETHPYYVKEARRDELFSGIDALLSEGHCIDRLVTKTANFMKVHLHEHRFGFHHDIDFFCVFGLFHYYLIVGSLYNIKTILLSAAMYA